jgi:1-acyl-sn-glycerol-3-phosphate acyltransferase
VSVAPASVAAAPTDRLDPFYAVLRLAARFWLWFFFRRVDARHLERVPAQGPVLLCINHPNNLIDSLVVGAVLPRKVHYLATAALFRNRLVARLLLAAGAVPIYRRQDDPDKMDRNVEAFAACLRAFTDGRVVAIYPEGTTHAESRVQRIKTGAARLALAYEVEHPGELAVVPVGLSFEARKSFRGRVLVSFGPRVPVTPYASAYATDPARAVDELTTMIQWAMERQVVHADRIETTALLRALEDVYRGELVRQLREERGLGERQVDVFRLSRSIVDAVEHFRRHDPERVERLWQQLQGYRALLEQYRVRDEAVRARLARPRAQRLALRSWIAVVAFPVYAYGAVVNAAPYYAPRWLARRLSRKETDYATIRLLSSVVAFPVAWTIETWVVFRLAGLGWAALFALSLPVAGLGAYAYHRGLGRLRGALRLGALSLTREHAARALLSERAAVVAELDRARDDYLAATRGSSF